MLKLHGTSIRAEGSYALMRASGNAAAAKHFLGHDSMSQAHFPTHENFDTAQPMHIAWPIAHARGLCLCNHASCLDLSNHADGNLWMCHDQESKRAFPNGIQSAKTWQVST